MRAAEYVLESSRAYAELNELELENARLGTQIARTKTSIVCAAGKIGRRHLAVEVPLGKYNDPEIIKMRLRAAQLGGAILHEAFPQFASQFVPRFIGMITVPDTGPSAIVMHDRTLGARTSLSARPMQLGSGMLLEQGIVSKYGMEAAFGSEVRNEDVMYGDDSSDWFVDAAAFMPARHALLAQGEAYQQAGRLQARWEHRLVKHMMLDSRLAEDVTRLYAQEQPRG